MKSEDSSTRLNDFFKFIHERNEIFHRRFVERKLPPWTNDSILERYKFTNVYRELDRGTLYLMENILGKGEDRDVILNVVIYRIFNSIPTFERIGFQTVKNFDEEQLGRELDEMRSQGETIFGSAYLTTGVKFGGYDEKHRNYLFAVKRDVVDSFDELYCGIKTADSLRDVCEMLSTIRGISNFIAYEIATDLNYSDIIDFSEDDWVNPGPGCKVGLSYLYPFLETHDDEVCRGLIERLRYEQEERFKRLGIEFRYWQGRKLTLRNIEHSLCEFGKYMKIKEGKGKRRKFRPTSTLLPRIKLSSRSVQRNMGEF